MFADQAGVSWLHGEITPDMFPHISDDDKLLFILVLLALFFGLFWLWNRRAKKWLEENGRVEESPNTLEWLLGERQPKPRTALKYSEQEFEEMVSEALDEVPQEFDKEWKNVAVIVSIDWPTEADKKRMGIPEGHLLLGTYSGIDRTQGFRSDSSRHVVVIYQLAIEQFCGDDKERVKQQIRKTVLHELAHHLGMSHQKMKEIGL
jgi:predicted Zn-dependent protease with MMP-like domain